MNKRYELTLLGSNRFLGNYDSLRKAIKVFRKGYYNKKGVIAYITPFYTIKGKAYMHPSVCYSIHGN